MTHPALRIGHYRKQSSLQDVANNLSNESIALPTGLGAAAGAGGVGLLAGLVNRVRPGALAGTKAAVPLAMLLAGSLGGSMGANFGARNALQRSRDKAIQEMSDDDLARVRSLSALDTAYEQGRMGHDATNRYESLYEDLPMDPYTGPLQTRDARLIGGLTGAGAGGAMLGLGLLPTNLTAKSKVALTALGAGLAGALGSQDRNINPSDAEHVRKMGPAALGAHEIGFTNPVRARSPDRIFNALTDERNLRNSLQMLNKESSYTAGTSSRLRGLSKLSSAIDAGTAPPTAQSGLGAFANKARNMGGQVAARARSSTLTERMIAAHLAVGTINAAGTFMG